MARINIEDLPQSDDLDRAAMRSVLGGGMRGWPLAGNTPGAGSGPIVEYPPGFGGRGARPAGRKRPQELG